MSESTPTLQLTPHEKLALEHKTQTFLLKSILDIENQYSLLMKQRMQCILQLREQRKTNTGNLDARAEYTKFMDRRTYLATEMEYYEESLERCREAIAALEVELSLLA